MCGISSSAVGRSFWPCSSPTRLWTTTWENDGKLSPAHPLFPKISDSIPEQNLNSQSSMVEEAASEEQHLPVLGRLQRRDGNSARHGDNDVSGPPSISYLGFPRPETGTIDAQQSSGISGCGAPTVVRPTELLLRLTVLGPPATIRQPGKWQGELQNSSELRCIRRVSACVRSASSIRTAEL